METGRVSGKAGVFLGVVAMWMPSPGAVTPRWWNLHKGGSWARHVVADRPFGDLASRLWVWFFLETVCVLLCFIEQILGNCYGPGGSSQTSQGARTNDWESPTYVTVLTLSSLRQSRMARFSPTTLVTSLAVQIPSCSSSNAPSKQCRDWHWVSQLYGSWWLGLP